jgi:hypothetical protein
VVKGSPAGATVVGVETEGATVVVELVEVVFTDVSIVTVLAVTAEVGPVFEAASETELAPSLTMMVPSLVHVAVNEIVVPDD